MGLGNWLGERAMDVGAIFNQEAKNYTTIRDAQNPSLEIMAIVGQQPGMDTPENKARIATITGDRDFMTALDSAIKSDSSIITSLADHMKANGERGGAQDPSQLLTQLADSTKRGVMTQFLGKIGEKPDDEFGGEHFNRIMVDAQKGDFIALNKTAQEMGIQSTALAGGAFAQRMGIKMDGSESAMDMVGNFIRNPEQGIATWLDNPDGPFKNMGEDQKNLIASVVKMLAGFANIYMPGNGIIDPYMEFAQHYGQQMMVHGAGVRAAGSAAPQTADAGTTTTAGKTSAEVLALNENSIVVPEGIRPARGGSFASAALGNNQPALEPDADVVAANSPARYENTVQGISMGGARI